MFTGSTHRLGTLASSQESNDALSPTKRHTFLKDGVTLSESEDLLGSQKAIVKTGLQWNPSTPTGYRIAKKSSPDVDGISTEGTLSKVGRIFGI